MRMNCYICLCAFDISLFKFFAKVPSTFLFILICIYLYFEELNNKNEILKSYIQKLIANQIKLYTNRLTWAYLSFYGAEN